MTGLPVLIELWRAPQRAATLTMPEWELVLRQALSANLTASLEAHLGAHGADGVLPAPVRRHLDWAALQARRHRQAVDWEIRQIDAALAQVDTPLVLLKGAAYAAARLPAGHGRLFSDIDVLVTRSSLAEVESALLLHGWVSAKVDAYDQRYYREWMHELPPMVHVRRDTAIDVHHTILPLTARVRPDPAKLLACAQPIPGQARVRMLAPADMVLHSATHLFYDGEFNHGLRDLVDIDRLLRQFGADNGFWEALPARAADLQLERPLFYALRYAAWLLDTPVPVSVQTRVVAMGPSGWLLALMDGLFQRALLPRHASCIGRLGELAHFALYVRGNWLRMPQLMLARHLWHKAFVSPRA